MGESLGTRLNAYEQSMNHISLKDRPRCHANSLAEQDKFLTFQLPLCANSPDWPLFVGWLVCAGLQLNDKWMAMPENPVIRGERRRKGGQGTEREEEGRTRKERKREREREKERERERGEKRETIIASKP